MHRIALFLSLFLLAGALASAHAWGSTHRAAGNLSLVSSSGAQAVAGGTSMTGDLAVRYRLQENWSLLVTGRMGGIARQDSKSNELLLGLLIGPCWTAPVGRSLLRVAVQATHIHHTSLHAWRAQTAANLAGDSSGTVLHRAGGEVAVGFTWPQLKAWDKWALVLESDFAAGVLPSSEALAWSAGVRMGVGFTQLSGN